jgi:hypothetical protein
VSDQLCLGSRLGLSEWRDGLDQRDVGTTLTATDAGPMASGSKVLQAVHRVVVSLALTYN